MHHSKRSNFILCALLIGWMLTQTTGAALASELPLRETPRGMLFGTERFAVRLHAQTGWMEDVLCDGQPIVQGADLRQHFDIRQDNKWVTGGGVAIEGDGVERVTDDTIKCRMRAGDWNVAAYVQLFPEQRLVRRWFEITWNGSPDTKIKGFWFQAGLLPLGEQGEYFCPGQYPPQHVSGSELVIGRHQNNSRSPYPVIGETENNWSAIWTADETPAYSDRGSSAVNEGERSIRVTQSFNMLGHMRRGVTQTVGDAWLWLQPNDAETALRRMPEWFHFVKQVPPSDRPDWLKRVILYSFHPGGTIGSRCSDLGGFSAATELLPHIHSLGCSAIWLMPLEDKSIYWPRDYYKFQEGLGTGEEYKTLTAKAHALGMRVWQDCVPHGGSNEYLRAKEHPEWLAQNEDGSTLHYWCFDFNWPSWIDYMSDVVSFYTREYGLDGFRIDACSGSKIPNWNPDIPYARASHAQAQGGLAMQRALRRAVKAIRPDGANLAEAGASIHGTTSDSTYDFSMCYHVLHDFRKVPADIFAPRLRRWLHEQQYGEIPDLVRMRHIESHDSLRSGLWYGVLPQRALLALISWIHGMPMVYHEMEDGNFDAFREVFHIRSHVAELVGGTVDYLSVTAPAGVFACLRNGELPAKDSPAWHEDYAWDVSERTTARASIVLVNLNGTPVDGHVSVPVDSLPAAFREDRSVRDLRTGESLTIQSSEQTCTIPVKLSPFGYTVLRFGSNPLPNLPGEKPKFEQTVAGRSDAKSAAALIRLATQDGTLLISRETGLATAWVKGQRMTPQALDLALPAELAQDAGKAICRETSAGVTVSRQFGSHTLRLQYARAERGGVDVRAKWQGGVPDGAAAVIDLPEAVHWQARTAEGDFGSPFRVRHPQFDGVVGSIYRLPQGTAVFWDSKLHPFGLSPDRAWVGALSADGRQTVLQFASDSLPGQVQLLDRAGDAHGMKVLMAWRYSESGMIVGSDELRFRLTQTPPDDAGTGVTGDERLQVIGGGWEFTNAYLRVRIARNGALTGLWRKAADGWQKVLLHGAAYTDRGYAQDKRFAQEDDVEASVRLERHGAEIRLIVCGAMRGFYRFDKMPHPVNFFNEYTLGDDRAFRYACAVKPEIAPYAEKGFLSLLLRTEGLDGVAFADGKGTFLTGRRGKKTERFAQTAGSATPDRLPGDIRVFSGEQVALRLGDIEWFGAQPGNLFMHGGDLHLAWMDGKPNGRAVGKWNGMTCSVACEDAVNRAGATLPLAAERPVELLRDSEFEGAGSSNVVLLATGYTLSSATTRESAWTLPPGAEPVTDKGNRCMKIVGDGNSYRLIRQSLAEGALQPGSQWRLRARLKGEGIQAADAGWKTACLRWAVRVDGKTIYQTASLPVGDCDWRTLEVSLNVPEKFDGIAVEAGMNGNKGIVWIDDVKVERAATP